MREYERKVGGYTVRQQLSERDAEALGVKTAAKRDPAPVAETKKVEPENKTSTSSGRRGRRLKRD